MSNSAYQSLFNETTGEFDSAVIADLTVTDTLDITGAQIIGLEGIVDNITIEYVGNLHVKSGGINTTQLADNSVNDDKLQDNAVITVKIADLNVTDAKIVSISGSKIIGPITADINAVNVSADYFKAGDGSAINPSYSFKNSTSSGLYLIGPSNIGLIANGSPVLNFGNSSITSSVDLNMEFLNIVTSGLVDGRDVSVDGATLDNLNTTIGLGGLTTAEVNQLKNIDSNIISNLQWTYLSSMNQYLTTASDVRFHNITIDEIHDHFTGNTKIIPINTSITLTCPNVGGTPTLVLDGFNGYTTLSLDLKMTGNLVISGLVDGRDVSVDGATLDNLNTTIGLGGLTTAEVNQLKNIGSNTISNTQWNYLSTLDQKVATTSNVVHNRLATANVYDPTITSSMNLTSTGITLSAGSGSAKLVLNNSTPLITSTTNFDMTNHQINNITYGIFNDGTFTNPAITWVGDLKTGFYRIGSNNIGTTIGGAKVLDISTLGLGITGAATVSTDLTVSNSATVSNGLNVTGLTIINDDGLIKTRDTEYGRTNLNQGVLAQKFAWNGSDACTNKSDMDLIFFTNKTVTGIDFYTTLNQGASSPSNFGYQVIGYVYIPSTGNISFRTQSDDSSDLYIDGRFAGSNYGLHAFGGGVVTTITLSLQKGYHKLLYRFLQAGSAWQFEVDWDLAGGTAWVPIPNINLLFYPADLITYSSGINLYQSLTTSSTLVAGSTVKATNAILTDAHASNNFYAEGTWTITAGDGTNNFTLSTNTGYYTRQGNMYYCTLFAVWSSKGSASGNIRWSLPATLNNSKSPRAIGIIGYLNGVSQTTQLLVTASGSTSYCTLYATTLASGAAQPLTNTSYSAAGEIQIAIYFSI